MYKLTIRGVTMPEIWVVQTKAEIETCRDHGLPYIIWFGQKDQLIKLALYPILKAKFPHIKWKKKLGIKHVDSCERPVLSREELEEQVIASSSHETVELFEELMSNEEGEAMLAHQQVCVPGGDLEAEYGIGFKDEQSLPNYVSGKAGIVHLDELAMLHVLPSFMEDITNNIKLNLETYNWIEGYNKKHGATIGSFEPQSDGKNLIILDVSGSIPDGISATMITLAETMVNIANADFILTGSSSHFFEQGTALPSPENMRSMCGYGNEGEDFAKILLNNVDGNVYDNVIVFGDNDNPKGWRRYDEAVDRLNVEVHEVWHYHTREADTPCGYGLWVAERTNANKHFNTDWCDCMEQRRW